VKIDTERGRKLYPRRVAIVEPVFANIRTQKRLDRFTLRGKITVTIQFTLLYGAQHRKDSELWLWICGNIK